MDNQYAKLEDIFTSSIVGIINTLLERLFTADLVEIMDTLI